MSLTCLKVARNPKIGDSAEISLNTQSYATEIDVRDSYKVVFSDRTATPLDAAVATDGTTAIPAIGSKFTTSGVGANVICNRVNPKRRKEAPQIFDVEVEWKNLVPQGSGAKWNINISVQPVRYEQDAWVDKTSPTPQNVFASNGQPYSPTLKKIYFDEEINVSFDCGATEAQNVLDATGDGVTSGCKGHFNDAPLTLTVNGVARTFPTATLLYASPRYSTVYVGAPPYDWKFELAFQYRCDNWLDVLPDRGTYGIFDGGAAYVALGLSQFQKLIINDVFGTPVTEPVLLNGSGLPLPNVAPGSTQTPVTKTYDMYGPADFTSLLSGIS